MQEQTKVVATGPLKAPTPALPSTPQPLDPQLLRQIAGGVGTESAPGKGW
jgi:hypothetical protein